MGERGPQPRREAERRRRNAPAHPIVKMGPEELQNLPFEVDYAPTPPDVESLDWHDENQAGEWHPGAQLFWDALKTDPARAWMTSADWAAAALVCESISRDLRPQVVGVTETGEAVKDTIPMKGANLSSYLKFLAMIGVGEASRLRIQKEITLFPPAKTIATGDNVVPITEARSADVL